MVTDSILHHESNSLQVNVGQTSLTRHLYYSSSTLDKFLWQWHIYAHYKVQMFIMELKLITTVSGKLECKGALLLSSGSVKIPLYT